MRLLRIFCLHLLIAAGATAQDRAPASVGTSDLAARARTALAELTTSNIVSADDLASAKAKIADEQENDKRAAAQLETELSYAEFVARMEDQSDEQLLSLLAPDGDIANNLKALATARLTIEEGIASATEKCMKTVRAIQSNENPYSQSAFQESAGLLEKIRERLEKLDPGLPYPEESHDLKEVPRPSPLSIREVVETRTNGEPQHVTRILGDVLLEMAHDESWRRDITEDPVVAGVEMLTERSVDIRVMIKTRPGQQWAVAREARRRIKRRFDELGIEIPFPHRVVHHVYEGKEMRREESRGESWAGSDDGRPG